MSKPTYNILITGRTLNEATESSVQDAFAKLFNISEEAALAAFKKAPIAVKKGVDELTAKKFKIALTRANIEIKIQREAADDTQSAPDGAHEAVLSGTQSSQLPQAKVYRPDNPRGFAFTIEAQPDFAFLTVQIPKSETIKVEASSMATMDTHMRMKTKMKGGFGRLLTGESLFINEFTAEDAPGEIGIAPGSPGDIIHRNVQGETLFLKNSAYLASAIGIEIETKLDIFKGIFSGSGLILIKCSGEGDLWFNTYGAAIEIDVDGEYIVDTDKIVAWTEGLEYNIKSVGGYKSLFFSGEGFVCHFSGKGKLWVQTRGDKAFSSWAHWYRPAGGKG